MKVALLGTLATASAIPVAMAAAPTSSFNMDLWLKELAAKTAAVEAKLAEANAAVADLQATVTSTPTPASQPPATDPHTEHQMAPTGAASLNTVLVNGLATLMPVPSGLDLASVIAGGQPVAASGKPDVVGAFRFHCEPSHLAYADPIVYPGGRSGKAHLHLFFGNTKADENSTYESLRRSGDSTCINAGNRSGYWEPAMIQTNAAGKDEVVIPTTLNIYYKRRSASDPWSKANGVVPVDIPRGLRFVFGFPDAQRAHAKCVRPDGSQTDWSSDIAAALAQCRTGDQFDISLSTPPCWDGKNLDSPDHRSRMSYTRGGQEHNWVEKRPASHPYEIPTFTVQSMFTILPTDRPSTWRFSSDMMNGGKRLSSFHADWFGAWEDQIADTWQAWCINRLLTCHSGMLGNGSYMKESPLYTELKKLPERRVSVPANG